MTHKIKYSRYNPHPKYTMNSIDYKKIYFIYFNTRRKWLINNANIWFNKTCINNQLTPKFAQPKNKSYSKPSKRSNIQYVKLRLQNEINYLYTKKNFLSLKLYEYELKNLTYFGQFWNDIKIKLLEKLSNIVKRKYNTLHKKIAQLKNLQKIPHARSSKTPIQELFNFHEPIKNLSDIQFSQLELEHIYNGYKSNLVPCKLNSQIDNLIVDSENIIQNSNIEDKNSVKYEIKQSIEKYIKSQNRNNTNNNTTKENNSIFSPKVFNEVISKIKDNNLTINKADKGNIITIDNKNNLKQKITIFLTNENFIKLKSDPTNRFQNEIKKLLKNCNDIFTDTHYHLINPNPKSPILRVTTKIHKDNLPIRPIVNYKPAPAYNIKKYINKILSTYVTLDSKYNIKNSIHLTSLLTDAYITPNSKIISLDIKDMYTNIPIQETLKIIHEEITLKYNTILADQIISILDTTLKQNYFTYNNEHYLQKDGLPMGSPLSSIISELFLQHLEKLNISKLTNKHNIVFYGRYVDDILIIYNNVKNDDKGILSSFNKLHPNLKFTLESENNRSINYLELNIKRTKNNVIFDIHRKPTTSKISILYNSNHPSQHKLANFHYLLNRLNNIPLSKPNYNKELSNIIEIAKFNNYPLNHIYTLNNRIKNKIKLKAHTTLNNKQNNNQTWHKMTYFPLISEKISHIFKKYNINISYKTINTTKIKLTNKDKNTDNMKCSGVYKLDCACGSSYIGRTTRTFERRLYEHKHSFKYNLPQNSAFAAHLLQNQHSFINSTFKPIKIIHDKRIIDIWEHLEIYKSFHGSERLVNEQIPDIDNPLFKVYLKNQSIT